PRWRAGLDASVLPRDYRDLLEVAEDAGRPLRAGQIAAAAGLSTDRGKVETLRAKLKRLGDRGWLAGGAGPGLFGLPVHNGNGLGDPVKPGGQGALLPRFAGVHQNGPDPKKRPMETYTQIRVASRMHA